MILHLIVIVTVYWFVFLFCCEPPWNTFIWKSGIQILLLLQLVSYFPKLLCIIATCCFFRHRIWSSVSEPDDLLDQTPKSFSLSAFPSQTTSPTKMQNRCLIPLWITPIQTLTRLRPPLSIISEEAALCALRQRCANERRNIWECEQTGQKQQAKQSRMGKMQPRHFLPLHDFLLYRRQGPRRWSRNTCNIPAVPPGTKTITNYTKNKD